LPQPRNEVIKSAVLHIVADRYPVVRWEQKLNSFTLSLATVTHKISLYKEVKICNWCLAAVTLYESTYRSDVTVCGHNCILNNTLNLL
jgi:hypothetical protein